MKRDQSSLKKTTISCDIAVVGGGASGLAAAIEAAQLGSRVVLVEKNPQLGGTTVMSIGSFTASNTSFQRKENIIDSTDSHFEDMGLFDTDLLNRNERDNLDLRRLYVDHSGPTLEWLRKFGVAFFGPMPEPPHSVARMHNVLPNSTAYIHHLRPVATKLGVQIITSTTVTSLIMKGRRVVGIIAEAEDQRLVVNSHNVILAAGDFSASQDFKLEFTDKITATVPGINPTSTGDGIRLGIEAGGYVLNGDLMSGPQMRFPMPSRKILLQRIPPLRILTRVMQFVIKFMPERIMRSFVMSFATSVLAPSTQIFHQGAILINKDGNRFAEENETPALALPDQPGGVGYIVFDSRLGSSLSKWPNFVSTAPGIAYAFLSDYRRNRKDIFYHAKSLADLAEKLDLPADSLANAVSNAPAVNSQETEWEAPYMALGPVQSWIVLTNGGLAIDAKLRVIRPDDTPVAGLYAAGSNGQGGLLLGGHGTHIGWAFISGRLAAQNAVGDRLESKKMGL